MSGVILLGFAWCAVLALRFAVFPPADSGRDEFMEPPGAHPGETT